MKTTTLLTVTLFLLILASLVTAENIYNFDTLETELQVNGVLYLKSTGTSPKLKTVNVDLLLYPKEDYRQSILSWDSLGVLNQDVVHFSWNDGLLETKTFGYKAVVKTVDSRVKVKEKVAFPVSSKALEGYEAYLSPTETIDSDNTAIANKASELAEGESDLSKVSFKVASWVEDNVDYKLDSLTVGVSQKASWVLEHREGVCDEMTSLFVAMMRSLGVPARFVSGISYSNSPLFDKPWQSHGWAEVYFPDIGWVSYDIAFGEFGYIDVTHIKLRDGFDPAEPATKFQWVSTDVSLNSGNLSMDARITKNGEARPSDVELEMEILGKDIGFGSYNLVKGILKNKQDYYTARMLQLSLPPEIRLEGQNKRKILLTPKEVRETYWIIRTPDNLQSNYQYTIPLVIYSETNASVEDLFYIREGSQFYTKKEIELMTVTDTDKTYSRKITVECDYPKKTVLGQSITFTCTVKNVGNTKLQQLNFCLNQVCDIVDLTISGEKTSRLTLKTEKAGWHKLFVSAENDLVEKKTAVEYAVYDPPEFNLTLNYPPTVNYGDQFNIEFLLTKNSFSIPKNITLVLSGPGFENQWTLEKLTDLEKLQLLTSTQYMSSSTSYNIKMHWTDDENKEFSREEQFTVKVTGKTFVEKLKLIFNKILY